MKVTTMRRSGFTLVEIMIVVAIIGLLAAIAIPNFVKARTASQRNACIANMKQIEGAKSTWALENKKTGGDQPQVGDLYGSDKYIAKEPLCPAGGVYTIGTVDQPPECDKKGAPDLHLLP
jgi:prepilin-type N-terminal cleavage/methylation domain-containing protein